MDQFKFRANDFQSVPLRLNGNRKRGINVRTMKLSELKERDVYEFSYANNFNNLENPKHWSEDSIYISDKNFYEISEYIAFHHSRMLPVY